MISSIIHRSLSYYRHRMIPLPPSLANQNYQSKQYVNSSRSGLLLQKFLQENSFPDNCSTPRHCPAVIVHIHAAPPAPISDIIAVSTTTNLCRLHYIRSSLDIPQRESSVAKRRLVNTLMQAARLELEIRESRSVRGVHIPNVHIYAHALRAA